MQNHKTIKEHTYGQISNKDTILGNMLKYGGNDENESLALGGGGVGGRSPQLQNLDKIGICASFRRF